MIEPLLKGPAGYDYLKNAFVKHYGSPSNAFTSLPLTARWISSVWHGKDQEWNEHKNSLLVLTNGGNSYEGHLPSATLRTGSSLVVNPNGNYTISVPSPATGTGLIVDANAVLNSVMDAIQDTEHFLTHYLGFCDWIR